MTTPTAPAAPAGWYADPQLPGTVRFFDGAAWTAHIAAAAQLAPAGSTVVPNTVVPHAVVPRGGSAGAGMGSHPEDPVHWLAPIGRTWQSVLAGYVGICAMVIWFLGPVSFGVGLWALLVTRQKDGRGQGRAGFAVAVGLLATIGAIWLLGQR